MGYKSRTIASVLPEINTTFLLPAMQREFVWTAEQICELFDSLMRRYPISSLLLWQVPLQDHEDVEAYEFLHRVKNADNRAQIAPSNFGKQRIFVLDGQQRLTSLLVGLQGKYNDRLAKSGKGSKTYIDKKLHLDLLHDGNTPNDKTGEIYYGFEFFDNPPVLSRDSHWFEVGRILRYDASKREEMVDGQIKAIRDAKSGLDTSKEKIIRHNLVRLHEAIWSDDVLSYHTEENPDHERILEIFVRANAGGTKLSKSDLLLSTLTLYWGAENAREVINGFVDELNTKLTRKNKLDKDFVMKSCLVLLNLAVAYKVSSFTKETCARIKERWGDIKDAIRRTVDAANAFGIDGETLTSTNALIPVVYYLFQNPNLTLRGESAREAAEAERVRVWLLSAMLNRALGGSSDNMLTRLREVLRAEELPNGEFPIAKLNEAIKSLGRSSGVDVINKVIYETEYDDDTCFLALSLLYDDRNWGTIEHSIDHLFPSEEFKKGVSAECKENRNNYRNLALVIGTENSGKKDKPLHEWLATREQGYLKRHCIPTDPALWHKERFLEFLAEREKLLRARLTKMLSLGTPMGLAEAA
jgi:uncharacterized protein DUF262